MTLTKQEEGIYVDSGLDCRIRECSSIIFDCDGVLIDVAKSYYLTIDSTVRYVLGDFTGMTDGIPTDQEVIERFKSTGGFNDEVDLTYALILSIAAAGRLGQDPRSLISRVITSDQTGIASVERYIGKMVNVSDIVKSLNYPGTRSTNVLYQIFNQFFYGSKLYRRISGHDSKFSGPGLIENDVPLVSDGLLDVLQQKFSSRMALVTGRGRESAGHSLGSLLGRFDLVNSFFLEDEPRDLAKPNPEPLLRSMRGMDSEACIYVGDSVEDQIMAQSDSLEGKAIFCGIIGTSIHPGEKLKLFERRGAPLVLESIDLLPKVLNHT